MEQSHFWIIQSVNFILVLALAVINVVIARKTSLAINVLSKINSFELETHYKLLMQFASFLTAIDEGHISIPSIKDSIYDDNTMDNLIHAKTEVETSYYKLLLMLSYAKTPGDLIENKIKFIMQEYREMHHNLFEGLSLQYRYNILDDKDSNHARGLLKLATDALVKYSESLGMFTKHKDNMIEAIRTFMKNEEKSIKKY